jgi:hypothetical protein
VSLADDVRSAVAAAYEATKDLHAGVTLRQWESDASTGLPAFSDPVTAFADGTPLVAIVERKHRLLRTLEGKVISCETKLTLLKPIAPNGAAGRSEPIDPRDRFTMQDGTTGPIVRIDGMQDAGYTDGRAFLYEVYMGADDARLSK